MDVCKESTGINLEEWHRENGVKEAPDDNILSNFAFAQEAIAMANSQPRRGRMKRLITELSTLRTSLPEGIYICHGSSRLDILKVLIMGPKGTPYEHGFFQFDLFCPADYPNSPPRMSFKNTGSGGVRFNPNLYEDGKICLSLLGTWSGEPWNANHSTILQVLVSIQSMILCQEPWYNEPGREMTKSNSMSTRYNNQIRAYTIDIVIRPWVNSLSARNTLPATGPVSPSSRIWEETVRLYLKANGKDICKAYSDAATQSRNTNLQSSVANLKESLKNQGYLD
ncbi:ubiquitin-conjugating enzyme/RWD-like protein [Biscogniauxia mediterranea]|nr:ubiquitin-conjugating enzyme/RWD-like protein [Biscogniauxia mediterranea]